MDGLTHTICQFGDGTRSSRVKKWRCSSSVACTKCWRPFFPRRLKKDLEKDLSEKVEKVTKVRMSALQGQLYEQVKKHKVIADGKDGSVTGFTFYTRC